MKLHVLSDLHVEFGDFEPPQTDADVVILAGDIHVGHRGLEWAMRTFPDRQVVYVLGNHEYYRGALPDVRRKLQEKAAGTNVAVLEDEEWQHGELRVLGCTLWTDFALLGDPHVAALIAKDVMTDYRAIRVGPGYRRLTTTDTLGLHRASRRWLEAKLAEPFDGRTVVVTHHAPSLESARPEWRGDFLLGAYASSLDELVAGSGAALWVHGHLHDCADYSLGATRVVCNPRGYVDEPNGAFRPGLVLEV